MVFRNNSFLVSVRVIVSRFTWPYLGHATLVSRNKPPPGRAEKLPVVQTVKILIPVIGVYFHNNLPLLMH